MNCVIVGDSNGIIHSSKKRGRSIVQDPFREKLEEIIVDQDLLDIKPIKGKYTWTNKRSSPSHITS
jgi:hypothetical protein